MKHEDSMWANATFETFQKAKILRKNMTYSENILWEELRNKKLDGLKFRRQHPFNQFILDFYCHKYKLAIEVDGKIHLSHDQKNHDIERTKIIEEFGVLILRFSNMEVNTNIGSVLVRIKNKVEEIKRNGI